MITASFFLTSLIVVLIPGTGVIFTISTALAHGRRAALFASFGCTVGIVPHLLATVLGLAAVLHASALAFERLRYAGAAYLLYLAVATWRDRAAFALDRAAPRVGPWRLALSGVFMAMTFAVFVVYSVVADAFRRAVLESPRVQAWLRRGFAAAFAGLGVNLALSDR